MRVLKGCLGWVVASVVCLVLYGLYCEYQFTPASGVTRFCTGLVPCF